MSAATFKEKGNKHLQAGEFEEAIAAYTEAINLESSNHVFFSNRSAAYLSKGDAASALSDATRCVQLNSNWPKGYSRKGAALHALRKYDEAAAAYGEGLKIAPDDSGLMNGLKEVKRIQETAAAEPPGGGLFGPQMLAKLAGHPKFGPKLGDPTFMAKLQMAQKNPQLLMADPEMMEVLQIILGMQQPGASADTTGSFDGASDVGSSGRPAPAPEPPQPPEPELNEEEKQAKHVRDNSNASKVKGNELYKAKNFVEALKAYDEALALDETNVMVLSNKAAVYIEMGECDTAIETCKSLFEKSKATKGASLSYEEKAKVYQRIAAAHLRKGDEAAALAAYGDAQMENFDKAIERKVKTMELELKKKAQREYLNPELGLEAKERGNAAFREGNFPLAITEYEEAVKRDPTNAAYRNNLAAAYLKMGVFSDAKRAVEKSLELDATYVKAWAKKGDIEFFMKEYHKAMDSYKAGLQLEADNSLCKQGLQKTMSKINELNMSGAEDKERSAHAMADPEIQQILSDPTIRQVLSDFQENPKFAQQAMANDASIRAKIERLIAAGVLQVR